MRAFLFSFVYLLCLFPALGAENAVEPLTSPAGHEFLFLAMPDATRVAIEVSWPSNWVFQDDRNQAVPDVGVATILTSGAGDLDAADFDERFADTFAEAGLYANVDEVHGSLLAGPDELDEALRLFNMRLTDPRLEAAWLSRARNSLKGNVELDRATVEGLADNVVMRAVLGDGPVYRFLALPDTSAIDAVTREDVMRWVDETFVAGGIRVAVAGPISPETAGAAVDLLLDGLPATANVVESGIATDGHPRRILLVRPDSEKTAIGFLGQLPRAHGREEYEDFFITGILSDGADSRLFEAIRNDLRATYGFSAMTGALYPDTGFLNIIGEVETGKVGRVSALVRSTYEEMRSQGVNESDIEGLKNAYRADLQASLEDPTMMASRILEAERDGYPESDALTLGEAFETITAATVNDRLRKVYPPADQLIEVVVSPDPAVIDDACVIEQIADVDRC